MVNNVCRNKKNLPNQIYESVTREVCQKNGITFVDFNHTCRCISKVCTEVEKSRATINSQVLSSMVCGDGQCLHIENIP